MPTENQIPSGSMATNQRATLDWSQDILEPRKQVWRLAAGDAPVTPQHTLKSVVKTPEKPTPESAACAKVKPWIKPASELASCRVGWGQNITEKLQQIANMGPAAASRYTRNEKDQKKPESKKPTFPTPEEREARRRCKKHKDWVVNHKEESIGECYLSIKRQVHRYDQEIRALQFFQPDDHVDLACRVLAIANWAEEFNGLSVSPIPDIPGALQTPYSGPLKAHGQFPLLPSSEGSGVTDVWTQLQAIWIYLCAILQYYEDDMAAREGALYGGKTLNSPKILFY